MQEKKYVDPKKLSVWGWVGIYELFPVQRSINLYVLTKKTFEVVLSDNIYRLIFWLLFSLVLWRLFDKLRP